MDNEKLDKIMINSNGYQKEFSDSIETMFTIHVDTASTEHGIRTIGAEGGYRKFTPTSFVYAFFEFNILYNYDWYQSINKGRLIAFDDDDYEPGTNIEKFFYKTDDGLKITEKNKIRLFIQFCFGDRNFALGYREKFYKILSKIYTDNEIKIAVSQKTIEVDETIKQDDIDKFLKALYNILDAGGKDSFKYDITDCLLFIYKIRCNLFHGHKTIRDIEGNPNQRTKLAIYFYFIIAVCQMLYSYLDYKRIPYITLWYEKISYSILCKEIGLDRE